MAQAVECYFLAPNEDVPNNTLPVLLYRHVLPSPNSEDVTTKFLTSNRWEKRGTWGHVDIRHFHPNSHECYGIFQGRSKLLLGQISPQGSSSIQVEVKAGDVIVLPAGTGHSCLESSLDYRYIGVYPKGCPRWRNEMGKRPAAEFVKTIRQVAMPEDDPVYGAGGPLMSLWRERIAPKL